MQAGSIALPVAGNEEEHRSGSGLVADDGEGGQLMHSLHAAVVVMEGTGCANGVTARDLQQQQ